MIPRIVFAGTKSGVGKTTITTGIMAALCAKGLKVQGFKVGPDYIDPSYHTTATCRPSANLDAWLMGENGIKSIYAKRTQDADIAVIEGVMGLFDGSLADGSGSTAEVAKILKAPVILILDCQSMGQSAAAHVLGFKLFDEDIALAGVILNKIGSKRHGDALRQSIEESTGVPVVGMVMRDDELILPSRHLGLIPSAEKQADTQILAAKTSMAVDLDKIITIAKDSQDIIFKTNKAITLPQKACWALAQDEAFTFSYQDGLDELDNRGIKLQPFSPLRDKSLPTGCQGLIIGGGFPEIYAAELSQNKALFSDIRALAKAGFPVYAECGGLMYLTHSIKMTDDRCYEMVGIVPAQTIMSKRLVAMGYVEATPLTESFIFKKDDRVQGHVFHYSNLEPMEENFPWAWQIRYMRDGKKHFDGYCRDNIFASYVHLHFSGIKDLKV